MFTDPLAGWLAGWGLCCAGGEGGRGAACGGAVCGPTLAGGAVSALHERGGDAGQRESRNRRGRGRIREDAEDPPLDL